ncbi:MAG: hypothetical protein JXB47_07485 [Anaerolineae bacterium]|nr:hypothetical protein [Anaerolineae bacterium]
MSYQIGIDTIHLRPTPRLAHTEYMDHDALVSAAAARAGRPFEAAWDFDWVWNTPHGPVDWAAVGRVTDMGHAEWLEGGIDRREPKESPFKTPEEVLAFDAVAEYGLPDIGELAACYEANYWEGRRRYPDLVYPGGYYRTVVSGAIDAFGWDMLLRAAADPAGFARVLDSFFRLSMQHFKAWAATSIEVFICHDDMVWTQGPFMRPDFYRRVIFPRYKELWAVLKAAGKKILYCSDGDWTMFVDDIAAAGADGFIFEPVMPLEAVVKKYGQTHVVAASKVDCRTLAFGDKDAIRAEIDATLALAFDCPGFVFAVGNHIPSNVSFENAEFYIEYLRSRWHR